MRRLSFAAAIIVVAFTMTRSAAAQTSAPVGFDPELAAQFEATLTALLNSNGTSVDPAQLPNLIGMPGEFDLPPGTPMLVAVASDAAAATNAADLGGGSSFSGPCMGVVMSFDADGKVIDMAADLSPDDPPIDLQHYYESGKTEARQALTKSNPFTVDVDGFVAYTGVAGPAGAGPTNHSWKITTFGTAVDSGGDPNPEGKNRNAGHLNLGQDLPAVAKVNALFKVAGKMTADNGFRCEGSGYFETVGGPPVLEGVGAGLVVIAGLGLLFNARPARTWRG